MDSGEVQTLRYAATPGLFGIAIKNLLLTVVTLSIYRFWAKTNMRRYLWRQVTIAGDALEYTGTGKELFLGFLIVIGILAPIAVILAVVQQVMLSDEVSAAVFQLVYFAAIIVLSAIALFRARRYRLSRTAWRGIHAGQDGSTFGYVVRWISWNALSVITLGLASPWARTALQRYLMRNTRFGDVPFSFTGSGTALFPKWLVLMAVTLAPIIAFVVANLDFEFPNVDPTDSASAQRILISFLSLEYPWLLLVAPVAATLAFVWYRVREFRYFVACSTLGGSSLQSAASARSIVLIYVVYGILAFVLPLVIIGGLVAMTAAASGQSLADIDDSPLFAVLPFVSVLLILTCYSLASALWLQPRLLRHVTRTTTIANPAVLDRVAQSTVKGPRFGEGLADAFDVG
jgi:uncharacterized membrane protein YjgN (DUF898 family)